MSLIEDAKSLQARAIGCYRSRFPTDASCPGPCAACLCHHSSAFQCGHVSWSFYDGSINYNGALPVSDATGTYSVPIFSYYHSFGFFGRSANVVASLPYGVGNFEGTVSGAGNNLYRSVLWIRYFVSL